MTAGATGGGNITCGFTWTLPPSAMAANMARYKVSILGAVAALMEIYGAKLQGAAQQNAPWTDRTANARQGISSATVVAATTVTLILFHTMDYGIWLEVSNGGRFAVLWDTVNDNYPALMAALGQLVGGGF